MPPPRSQGTRAREHALYVRTQQQHRQSWPANHPGVMQKPYRHSRCSTQARTSGLAGAERAKSHSRSMRIRRATSTNTERAHRSSQHHYPGIMQKPGIPAQQMQRKGTHKRACGSRTGQNALAKHAHAHSKKHHRGHIQPNQHHHPGIMQKPGIPAQQMQRTGTRERA